MENFEYIWAAGFFDGEGHTYVTKHPKRPFGGIRMRIRQKDVRPLIRFQEALGGRIIQEKSGIYSLECEDKKAREILSKLYPFLSEPKREQYDDVLRITQRTTPC